MKVTYEEGVFEELVSLSGYLADEDDSLAQAFLNACDSTFIFLAKNKFAGSGNKFENLELSDVRMWRVKGFEMYLIFYVPTESGIKLLHILHSATDYNRAFDKE